LLVGSDMPTLGSFSGLPVALLVWPVALASPLIVLLILETVPLWLLIGLLPSVALVVIYVLGRIMADD
jgi:hypothetical protein